MQNDLISIIIINYRQKKFLIDCIKSIYSIFQSHPFEVIVINNSPEENLNELQSEKSNLKIIENQNKGFAQANNLGAKHSGGNYLLFLNCDILIKNDFLKDLFENFCDKEFGAAGLRLQNPDGSFQLSFWKENTFRNEISNKKAEKLFKKKNTEFINQISQRFNSVKNVEWVSGAALFLKKKVFDEIAGFNEKFFLFYEDVDLCKRLKNKGLNIYFFPNSDIIHFKGENVNQEFSDTTYYYSKESQLLYYKLHNNLFDRILLRIYLFSKFLILSLITFKNINFRILKLSLGIKND
jgi:GT2 family glycosyltransferase